eukprot:1881099-Rhodomonas_salina.1
MMKSDTKERRHWPFLVCLGCMCMLARKLDGKGEGLCRRTRTSCSRESKHATTGQTPSVRDSLPVETAIGYSAMMMLVY